jgi:Peptidase family M1 domain
VPSEPNWLFSNRSFWYPQAQVTDYATSRVRVTVPLGYAAVATGVPAPGNPMASGPTRSTYTFIADQPARYIGLVVSKMAMVDSTHVALDIQSPAVEPPREVYAGGGILIRPRTVPPVGGRNTILLSVAATRRQAQRGRDIVMTAAEILRFYAATIGDVPYDAMTLAMVESNLPGGHSPAYMAMMNNPAPMSPYTWRNDPAAFSNYPEFYLAHEMAHQWWGQAVGWQNYHEQWLSEGIAQYFAALYAKERRGDAAFRDVIRQFRRWAVEQSDQGSIYLGYRLGHLKNDSRIFRAVVYNKSAAVLHMLRRLIGDDAFFKGIRRFYVDNRFKKAGTQEFQRAMETASGRSLERFFQRWIFESGIPRVRYSATVEGQELIVRFEQVSASPDLIYDLPVTLSIQSGDRATEQIVVIDESTTEKRFPLTAALRNVEVNADSAAVAIFERR